MKTLKLHDRTLLSLFAASTLIGLAGVFLSYHTTVTSSAAWITWGNDQAWFGDSVRLVALCALATLLITTSFRAGRKRAERTYSINLSKLNLAVSAVFLTAVLTLNFYYYPIYFEKELLKTTNTLLNAAQIEAVRIDYFGQVYKPLLSYIFYALAIWIGIILPTFLIFLDGFLEDQKLAKQAISEMRENSPQKYLSKHWREAASLDVLQEAIMALSRRNDLSVTRLRLLVQRYLPAVLVVVIGYVLFNVLLSDTAIGPGKQLAKTQTAEARDSFGWIIIIFLLISAAFTWVFSSIFREYRYSIEESIEELEEFLTKHALPHPYVKAVVDATDKLDTRRKNVATFMMQALFAAGSLSLPILTSFTAAIAWMGVSGYADELIPKALRDLVSEKFTREVGPKEP